MQHKILSWGAEGETKDQQGGQLHQRLSCLLTRSWHCLGAPYPLHDIPCLPFACVYFPPHTSYFLSYCEFTEDRSWIDLHLTVHKNIS